MNSVAVYPGWFPVAIETPCEHAKVQRLLGIAFGQVWTILLTEAQLQRMGL